MKNLLTVLCATIVCILAGCAQALAAADSANLTWVAPTTFTNGSPITGAITYNVYQGATGAEALTASAVSGTTWAASSGLTPGSTVCWQVTAVVGGVESARSNEACKSFPAQPNPPTLTVS